MILVRDFLTDQQILRSPAAPQHPTVSVILPTYSRRRTGQLERAISSVLRQTFADLELIVLDDGSRDGSFDLIQTLQARDPRLVHVRHERNSGIHILRTNEGIELARGRYVAFQFDDDRWRPRALHVLVERAAASGCIAVGKAELTSRVGPGSFVLPPADGLSIALLHAENRIANNALLIPRELFHRHGMYDCHIGMRRLCDWDLWLRLIRHVEFSLVEEVVSDVSIYNPGAIALTVPLDLALFRHFSDVPRDELLTPARWRDYAIDARRIGEVELAPDIWHGLYEEQIAPYYSKFRHLFPVVEGFPSHAPSNRREVLHFCSGYSPTNEIALRAYDSGSSHRNTYKAHFQYGNQLSARWRDEGDMMLMSWSPAEGAVMGQLMAQGVARGLAMGVYLGEEGATEPEAGRAAEGRGRGAGEKLRATVAGADAVWVTRAEGAEWVRRLNGRMVPHQHAVPEEWLTGAVSVREAGRRIRIGWMGSGDRLEEGRLVWAALGRVAAEYGDGVEVQCWGVDVGALPPLGAPVRQGLVEKDDVRWFRQLAEAGLDIVLMPRLDRAGGRGGGAWSAGVHVAVAGAVGIVSRGAEDEGLTEGLTCLKAESTVTDWYRALRAAVEMPGEELDLMRRRTLAQAREECTERARIHGYEAAWRATEFHAKTRGARGKDGRPRVLYVVGEVDWEGEIRLRRWLGLLRQYGVEPVVVVRGDLRGTVGGGQLADRLAGDGIECVWAEFGALDAGLRKVGWSGAGGRGELGELLERVAPAVVHTVGLIPVWGEVCAAKGVPHVASLYAIPDDAGVRLRAGGVKHCAINHSDSVRYARRWREWLHSEAFCAREVVGLESFEVGLRRHLEGLGGSAAAAAAGGRRRVLVAGSVREEGGQLEAIGALGALGRAGVGMGWELEVWGGPEPDAEVVRRCRERIEAEGLGERVHLSEAGSDGLGLVRGADMVLNAGRGGGFPLAIKEAMAVGVLVVSTPVGGVPELVIDGVSGIVCGDGSLAAIAEGLRRAMELSGGERQRLREQGRRVARSEFHPQRGASDLLEMYNRAIDVTRSTGADGPGSPGAPGEHNWERIEEPPHPPAGHARLHRQLTYRVTPQDQDWHGMDVLVATHQQEASGRVRLTVLSSAGTVVRTATVQLATARDNDWLRFEFAPIADAAGCPFLLRFTLADPGPRTKLSLYDKSSDSRRFMQRVIRRLGLLTPRKSLYCRMRYAK